MRRDAAGLNVYCFDPPQPQALYAPVCLSYSSSVTSLADSRPYILDAVRMVAYQTLLTSLSGLAAGAVLPRATVPSDNGFPMPNDQQKIAIAQQAGGLLPNSPPATSLGAGTTTAFQLIAFNELFETAYFSSLAQNISDKVPGYDNVPAGALNEINTVVAVSYALITFRTKH